MFVYCRVKVANSYKCVKFIAAYAVVTVDNYTNQAFIFVFLLTYFFPGVRATCVIYSLNIIFFIFLLYYLQLPGSFVNIGCCVL